MQAVDSITPTLSVITLSPWCYAAPVAISNQPRNLPDTRILPPQLYAHLSNTNWTGDIFRLLTGEIHEILLGYLHSTAVSHSFAAKFNH
jgi:hypothetical protein